MQATRGCGCRPKAAPNSDCSLPELLRRKTFVTRLSLWLARRRPDGLPYSRCHSAENPANEFGGGKKITLLTDESWLVTSCAPRKKWWSQTGSNRRPPACKAGALPTELWPRLRLRLDYERRTREPWWAWEDLNFRPHAYQARALTN